jgi:hypothetical protein
MEAHRSIQGCPNTATRRPLGVPSRGNAGQARSNKLFPSGASANGPSSRPIRAKALGEAAKTIFWFATLTAMVRR